MAIDPNMGFTYPTDHGDAETWGVILDNALAVIGAHNHSPGGGAQINFSSLKWDADISAVDPGGGKHAIYNLLAIDFFPSPPSAMTGFSGAFFVSDGTSGTVNGELYFRSTLGTNIQFTSGGTLNVGAFAGTIGGDYVGVAAAEIFDDSSDAYWFQQQVGGGVRQFAKMRCADLSLFEFKAVAAGPPVPTQAVTLKSPAALAAGYSLTFPGALPVGAAAAELYVDSAGNVSAGPLQTIQLPVNWKDGSTTAWRFAAIPSGFVVPIPLKNGDRIRAVRARIQDNATGPTKVTIGLQSVVDGVASTVATSAQSAGSGANQTIAASGLTTTIASGTNYQAVFTIATGAGSCIMYWVEIDYDRP